MGIPIKLISLIRMTMMKVKCMVRVQGMTSESFYTYKELRQGDCLACLLFNLVLGICSKEFCNPGRWVGSQ